MAPSLPTALLLASASMTRLMAVSFRAYSSGRRSRVPDLPGKKEGTEVISSDDHQNEHFPRQSSEFLQTEKMMKNAADEGIKKQMVDEDKEGQFTEFHWKLIEELLPKPSWKDVSAANEEELNKHFRMNENPDMDLDDAIYKRVEEDYNENLEMAWKEHTRMVYMVYEGRKPDFAKHSKRQNKHDALIEHQDDNVDKLFDEEAVERNDSDDEGTAR